MTSSEGISASNRIVKNVAWISIDQIVRLCVGLFLNAWTARYLAAEGFGLLNYCISIVSLCSFLFGFGIDSIIIREITRSPSRSDKILATAIYLKLISALGVIATSRALVFILNPNRSDAFSITLVLSIVYIPQSFDAINLFFLARKNPKKYVVPRIIAFGIAAALRVFILLINGGILALAAAGTIEMLLGALGVSYYYVRDNRSLLHLAFSASVAKELLRDSWPLLLSSLSVLIYIRIGQLMLANMTTMKEQGLYSAAVRVSEMWYFIPMAIVSAVFPLVVERRRESGEVYFATLQQLFTSLTFLGLLISSAISVFSTFIINLFYGAGYRGASLILSIHSWAGVFVCLGVGRSQWVIAENLSVFSFYSTLAGAVSNVILNLLLIPKMMGVGAALSLLTSQAIAALFATPFMNRKIFVLQLRSFVFYGLDAKYIMAMIKRWNFK